MISRLAESFWCLYSLIPSKAAIVPAVSSICPQLQAEHPSSPTSVPPPAPSVPIPTVFSLTCPSPVFSYYSTLSHSSQLGTVLVMQKCLPLGLSSSAAPRLQSGACVLLHAPSTVHSQSCWCPQSCTGVRSQSPPSPVPCQRLAPAFLPPGTTAPLCWEPSPIDGISL